MSEDPARVRAREAHRESLGAATRGSDEQVAVGHAVRVDAHVVLTGPKAAARVPVRARPLRREWRV